MDEQAFRLEVRQFIHKHFPEEWRFPSYRLSLRKTESWQRMLHEKGWGAPSWPREYGGMGLNPYEQIIFQDEMDKAGVNIAPNAGITMLGPLLIRYGSEEQKKSYLPDIMSGKTIWAQGYSEPGAGSDLANLRTSAVLDGDHFVVNGQKIWTSFAHEADMIFLLVRTDKDAKKQEGISFLLVDMKSPGITVKRITNISGHSEFCEVFFDNVRVPQDSMVGAINKGWSMAKSLLGSERITLGSPKIAKYPLSLLKNLAEDKGLFADPVFTSRYTEIKMDVDDLNAAFVRFADVLRRGEELGPEVSLLKIWITEVFQRVTDMLVEYAGEHGCVDEMLVLSQGSTLHPANQYFISRPSTIYGGTNEVQRNILAKAVLQLPG